MLKFLNFEKYKDKYKERFVFVFVLFGVQELESYHFVPRARKSSAFLNQRTMYCSLIEERDDLRHFKFESGFKFEVVLMYRTLA